MGELKGCLEDALSGRGRLVTLAGEPGVGKTRIAQELAVYAEQRGALVLWGGGAALLALGPVDTIGHLLGDANRDLQDSANSDRNTSLQGL